MNPFTDQAGQSIGSVGEVSLIESLHSWLGQACPPSPRGIGDDCAVLPLANRADTLLVTTDPIVYGRHFDDELTPENAASKLLRRNLSDIAAMGGRPAHATLSLSAPDRLSLVWLRRFYEQIAREAERYAVEIVGGDLCGTNAHLGIYLTLIGYSADRILVRQKAQPDDLIFVTGTLGGTRLKKHYDFEPRIEEGKWLARRPEPTSCMDLSDGLGKDLVLLLPRNLGAKLDGQAIPISDDARSVSNDSGKPPLFHAFNDGEDYELVFTADKGADVESFQNAWKEQFPELPLTCIGSVTERSAESRLLLENTPDEVNLSGYEHFRRA